MAARPTPTVKFVYYHPNLCCSCKARYQLLVAGGLTPLDAAEAAPWRSYSLRSQATVRLARCLSLLCCMPLTLPANYQPSGDGRVRLSTGTLGGLARHEAVRVQR